MAKKVTLLDTWRAAAYNENAGKGEVEKFWDKYLKFETGVYEQLLENPDEEVKGTVKELADKYGTDTFYMTGFLDGINECLVEENPLETMDENTEVSLKFDKERLYKKMVEVKANWLYELPQWKNIFSEEKLKELFHEQKLSGTVVREGKKIGRNDPCPCGSGKKYKQCCMRKDIEAGKF